MYGIFLRSNNNWEGFAPFIERIAQSATNRKKKKNYLERKYVLKFQTQNHQIRCNYTLHFFENFIVKFSL